MYMRISLKLPPSSCTASASPIKIAVSCIFRFFSCFYRILFSVVCRRRLLVGSVLFCSAAASTARPLFRLSIVFLDPSAVHVVAPSAAHAPLAAPSSSRTGGAVAASDSDAEQYRRDQQRHPAAPAEAKGIPSQTRVLPVRDEGVAHLDEDGRHERDGDGVEEQCHQCR